MVREGKKSRLVVRFTLPEVLGDEDARIVARCTSAMRSIKEAVERAGGERKIPGTRYLADRVQYTFHCALPQGVSLGDQIRQTIENHVSVIQEALPFMRNYRLFRNGEFAPR